MSEHWSKHGTKMLPVARIETVDRIIDPTRSRIGKMVKSLSGSLGQIEPILVTKYLISSWRVVAGATRLAAAKELGWKEIEATIIFADNSFEYGLIEIAENLDRHDLSDGERAKLKEHEKELRAKQLEHFKEMVDHPSVAKEPPEPPAKRQHRATGKPAGRPEGGVRSAARKAGVPQATARRVVKGYFEPKTKVAQNSPAPRTKKCPTCNGTGKVEA